MAQKKVFLALACLVIVLATNAEAQGPEFTDEQLQRLKKEMDTVVVEKNASCENYKEVCQNLYDAVGLDFSHICEVVYQIYLCEGPQDLDTIRRIAKELFKNSQEGVKAATEPNEV